MAKRRNRQRNFNAMNSPRLRPYHNPENVDESRVPEGWRFLYADELIEQKLTFSRFWTYIVPVA
jgi:hypothetical protein